MNKQKGQIKTKEQRNNFWYWGFVEDMIELTGNLQNLLIKIKIKVMLN